MKAALCKSLDGPAAIEIADLPAPRPGPGQVVLAVKAAALNFMDVLMSRGKYQFKPDLPFSPAAEIAGVIEELGAGVSGFEIGQRVCAFIGWGGAREKLAVNADQLIPVPDNVSDEVAAGISVTYGTAFHGLEDRARLKAGETVVVLGASGGAGLAAVEVASRLGGDVIAVASSDERLRICADHGARHLLNYKTQDLKQGLRDLSGGKGIDIIYDCVGGDDAEAALRAIAWQGRFLVVGFASGEIPCIPLNLALLKGCDILGVFWSKAVELDPARHRDNMLKVLDWIAADKLSPRIHGTYPLEKISEAIAVLDRREAKGKVVITF